MTRRRAAQVDLSGCYCLRGTGLSHLQPLPRLVYLNLSDCSGLEAPVAAQHLAAMPALRKADVRGTPLAGAELRLRSMPRAVASRGGNRHGCHSALLGDSAVPQGG